jgi:hypothetical protein
MGRAGTHGRAHAALLVIAVLFLADLFVGWHRTGVDVPGSVHMHATSVGWSGWGFIAGAFAIGLAAVEIARRAGEAGSPPATLVLALGLLGSALAATLTGGAGMHVGGVDVGADATRWPGWAGVALAGLGAATALWLFLTAEATDTAVEQGAGP